MNAFKKELAGILLDSNQTIIAMQHLVEEMDYVLKNWENQKLSEDYFGGWGMFLEAFYNLLGADIQKSVDFDVITVDNIIFSDSVKEKTRLYIFLTKYFDYDIGKDSLFDSIEGNSQEKYIEFYNSLEKEIFA